MGKIARVIVMVVAVLAFMIPTYKLAKAAAWHSGSSYGLGVGYFCTDGVKVTLLSPQGNNPGLSLRVNAYLTPYPHDSDKPIMVDEIIPIGDALASVVVTEIKHLEPYQPEEPETFPEEWEHYDIYWYGSARLKWETQAPGTVVAVQQDGVPGWSFVGRIMDCTVGSAP